MTANVATDTFTGLAFNANNETWIVPAGVVIYSPFTTVADAAGGPFTNNTLINQGLVHGGSGWSAIRLDDLGDVLVVNRAGGQIVGSGFAAIYLEASGNNRLDNFGTIIGADSFGNGDTGVTFDSTYATGAFVLNNYGYIFGDYDGVLAQTSNAEGAIHNFKMIRGLHHGVEIDTHAGVVTSIGNAAGATIRGHDAAIFGSGGAFKLLNHGTLAGNVVDADGANDRIINTGKITGKVELGSGNCYFNGTGGTSGTIVADGGSDRIIAGKGNVLIELGGGSSTLTGGPGHDRFFFNSALAGQVDKITNFTHGLDKIVLSSSDFAGVGPVGGTLAAADFHVGQHAATAAQYIIYNPANGFVLYDPHDKSPQIHFATLSPHLALTHGDFLVAA